MDAQRVTGAPTWAGNVVIRALEEGGDVNTRLTTDWEFDISGRPLRTPEVLPLEDEDNATTTDTYAEAI